MPKKENSNHLVVFQPSGRRGHITEGENLKQASRELGVDIEGVCGDAGTCGTCKVKIEDGSFPKYGVESKRTNLSPVTEGERKFINAQMEKEGFRLACEAEIYGDVVVFVPEESRMGKQVVRKEAKDIAIDLQPAVRKYQVALPKATLDDPLGDWERLQEALKKEFDLKDLAIDYQALKTLQKVVRQGNWKVTVSVWMNKEIIKVEPGSVKKVYGLAVDIGTTTVAGYLCDLHKGDVVATVSMMNPQVIYGEDVMSRITYHMTNKDGLKRMNKAIIKGLNEIIGSAAKETRIRRGDIIDLTIVGNTCMHHVLLNIDPLHIGRSPFPPAAHQSLDIRARDLGIRISPGAYVHVLPIEAGFVGADNVGVLIAEAPYEKESMALIIDIGTNGELILGNREKLLSCSCATGPAFEGAEIKHGMRAAPGAIEKIAIDRDSCEVRFKVIGNDAWNTDMKEAAGAKGICGSGIIDVVPQLFIAGIIDHTGRFNKDLQNPRFRITEDGPKYVIAWAKETSIGQDIVITQLDIRNIQLAKGAMYAGAKIMMRHLGVEKVDKVVLAGAFGSHIDKKSAACLGLFPDCALENISVVGNAAGDGARMALLNVDKRTEANEMARQVEYVELTVEKDFDKIFAKAMWLPHMKDRFPHIEDLLPKKGE